MRSLKVFFEEIKFFFYGNFLSYIASKNNKLLVKNKKLHNKYSGKRIFIFYSGKSLKNVDFTLFKNEYVMGVNLLVLHDDFEELDVDFYTYTGSWNYSLSKYMAWGLFEIYAALNSKAKIILNSSSYYWINNLNYCGIVDNRENFKDNTYFINNKSFILDSDSGVNCNLPKSLHGVFSRSIGIAIDMGFDEIYLVGCDYSKDPVHVGHFYGSTNYISDIGHNDDESNVYNRVRKFANDKDVKIFNLIDKGFTSPFFLGITQSKLKDILKKS